jgi:hypothetical protein
MLWSYKRYRPLIFRHTTNDAAKNTGAGYNPNVRNAIMDIVVYETKGGKRVQAFSKKRNGGFILTVFGQPC